MSHQTLQCLCVLLCFNVVLCQFGFFTQREERPYRYGLNQNFFPNTRKIANTLSGILNFQPENSERFSPFVNPFNQRRPINNPSQYENGNQNQYGNPSQNGNPAYQNEYPSNNVRFPNQNTQEVYNVNMPPETPQNEPNQPELPQNEPNQPEMPQYLPNQPEIPQYQPNQPEIPQSNGNHKIESNIAPTAPVFVENESTALSTSTPFVKTESNNPNSPPYNAPTNNDSNKTTAPVFVDTTTHKEQGLISGTVEKGTNYFSSFENRNDIPSELSPYETTRLPPLTPVTSDSRSLHAESVFHNTCKTVDGVDGSCVAVVNCTPYVRLLKEARTNTNAVATLRQAHCGFEGNDPKVCCPPSGIPESPPPELPATPAPATSPPAPSGKSVEPGDFISALPEPPVCGLSNATFTRVVGGVDAKLGDFPWMALLGYRGTRGQPTRFLCGGSLVSSRHIVTAAHCVHNREKDLYVVRLGELDLSREDDGATPVDVLIKKIIKHEEYNPKSFANDIAVLLLEEDVDFTDLIKPICIPLDSELRSRSFVDYTPFIAGWGDTEFRGPSADHLQVLQIPVVTNEACSQAYQPYAKQITIDQRVLCAGYKSGGKDACQGDSGGPLMQPVLNPQSYKTYFYQIGVVSFGKKCAEPGFPGVYTRVSQFVPWLQKTLLGA